MKQKEEERFTRLKDAITAINHTLSVLFKEITHSISLFSLCGSFTWGDCYIKYSQDYNTTFSQGVVFRVQLCSDVHRSANWTVLLGCCIPSYLEASRLFAYCRLSWLSTWFLFGIKCTS